MKHIFSSLIRGFFLVVVGVVSMVSCQQPKGTLNHEQAVFAYYMDMIGQEIPQEPHLYYLLGVMACGGCQTCFAQYYIDHDIPEDYTIICEKSILSKLGELPQKEGFVLDSANVLQTLNWKYNNLIEVETDKGELTTIRAYTSMEIFDKFRLEIPPDPADQVVPIGKDQ